MQEHIRHTDESYRRTIALLRADGDDYAAILTERLWAAQQVIDRLVKALEAITEECPSPKLPYGMAVVRIARKALAAVKGEA